MENLEEEKKGAKKFCANCGKEIAKGSEFCSHCGTSTKASVRVETQPTNYSNNNNNSYQNEYANLANIPSEYKPISMWGYFGYELLFSLPCVGFILLIVFSFGGTQNKNLRNFARSYFCLIIVLTVILVLLFVILGIGGAAAYGSYSRYNNW